MYVKQLEWAKWAAVDEMRKEEAQAAAVVAASSVVTPATPPAEADEEDPMNITDVEAPSTPKNKVHIPPVTPSKHVTAATARAGRMTPPGQPRKTPVAKRTATVAAVDEDNDDDEDEAEEPAVGGTGVGRPLPPMKDSAIGESVNANEAPAPPPPPLCGGGCNDEEELEPPDPDAVAYGCPPLVFGRGAVLIAADPVELAAL